MSKYNAKAEGVKPTVVNAMGENAYQLSAKEELVSTCMTTFLSGDHYYETEKEVVNRIVNKLNEVDPLFAAKLALYVRNEGNLRSVSHLIAATIAKRASGTEWSKRFYNKIVVRPDDMSEILSAYAVQNKMDLKKIRKIPNAIKKGFKTALERLDAYQIDKYKMNSRQVKMLDLVNLFHPKGTQRNQQAYHNLVNGESLAGLYASKVLEKEMTKAGQKTQGKSVQEKEAAKKEAIENVLSNVKGMPIMNLLRNLRNIILYAPKSVDDACAQLTNETAVLNSRLLPFRFATAYEEIEKMSFSDKKSDTSIAFEEDYNNQTITATEFTKLKEKVLNAIEDALQISCQNIPELEGNTAILIDHSGSVRGDSGGSSRVSAFSKTTTAMIGNLFGSMMAYRQKNVYIGLFGDRLIPVKVDRSQRLLDFNKKSFDKGANCGGGTEQGIYDFFRQAVREKKKIDNIIVFSDCQIGSSGSTSWYGTSGTERSATFQDLIKQFRKINPLCNIIVVDIHNTRGNNVFYKPERVLNIAGWSANIFDVIKSNTKGFGAILKEIEAIEI